MLSRVTPLSRRLSLPVSRRRMSTSSSPSPSSEAGRKKTVTGAGTTAMKRPLKLPRLPVPRLRDTLDRYLKSLEPFLLEDEVRGGLASSKAMQERIKWTNEFERGLGKTLQERLMGTCVYLSVL